MTDPVLTALTQRRSELVKEAKAFNVKLDAVMKDIEHIDGAIRTYDRTYREPKVIIRRAARLSVLRPALAVLREAGEPMTLRQLTLKVMAVRGADTKDKALVTKTLERLRLACLRQREAGVLRSVEEVDGALTWEVVR